MFSFLLTSSQKKKGFLFLNICRLRDIIKCEEKKDIITFLCSVLLTCKQMEQQNSRHGLIILQE